MFGKDSSFTKCSVDKIPGPQTKSRRQGMFVKSAVFAQLQRACIRMLHIINAPTLGRAQGVAERCLKQQLRFVAQLRVIDVRKELQTARQMVQRFALAERVVACCPAFSQ